MMRYQGVPTSGEQVIPNGHNIFKIAFLFFVLFGAFAAGHFGALKLEHAWVGSALGMSVVKWGWLLFCGVISAAAAQGLGVLAHDAVHKVLFSRLWLNELVGGIISAFSLLPFNANRQFHMAHHRFSHRRGLDPEHPMHNHHVLFGISIGSLIGLALQYKIFLANLFLRITEKSYFRRVVKDILYLTVAGTTYFFLLPFAGLALEHTLVPMLLTLPLVFGVRAISDHYGLPAVEQQGDAAGSMAGVEQEVSGWVILTSPMLEWLWSNVNYHEVHHKFPYLSHYYLRTAFAATKNELPYAVAKGYFSNLWRHRQRDYYHASFPDTD